jgi:hypothetical protein
MQPLDILKNILKAYPRSSEKTHRFMAREAILADPEARDEVFDYWFENRYAALYIEARPGSVAVLEAPKNRRASSARAAVEKARDQLRAALFDHVLSNGKTLREATFGDCAKEGGWLCSIAKLGRANEIVGKKLEEKDLTNLWKRANR